MPRGPHGCNVDGVLVDDDEAPSVADGLGSSSEAGSYNEGVVIRKDVMPCPECSSILGTEYGAKRISRPEVGPGATRTRTPWMIRRCLVRLDGSENVLSQPGKVHGNLRFLLMGGLDDTQK